MGSETSGRDFAARVPEFLQRVWMSEAASPADIRSCLRAAGLDPSTFWEGGESVSLTFGDDALEASMERRIRTSVTRTVGRPAGSAKQWDLDTFLVSLGVRDGVLNLHLHSRYPLARVRSAAVAWLDGRDVASWGQEFGFVDQGRRGAGTYFDPGDDARPPSAHVSVPVSTRPTGSFPDSDDESYQMIVDYLSQRLGAPGPGTTAQSSSWFAWRGDGRKVDVTRSRGTRMRTIGFHEDRES